MAQACAAVGSAVDVSTSAALITTVNTTRSRWNTIKSVCAVEAPAVPIDALHSDRQPNDLGAQMCSNRSVDWEQLTFCVPPSCCCPVSSTNARDVRP